MHVHLFGNPIAGRGKARAILKRIEDALIDAECGVTVHTRQASIIDDDTLAGIERARAIIVVGGDGTLRTVTTRLVRHLGERGVPPIAVVPMGTANLMGRYLGIHWNPKHVGKQVVEMIKVGKTISLDAASVKTESSHELDLMLLVAGVGIDAAVVHELDRIRSGPITMLSYALPAALAFGMYQFPEIEVEVDGEKIWRDAGIALVGNVKEYGTGFPVLPHARPDDGLLDVCAMPCKSRGDLLKLFLSAAAGEHLTNEGVIYRKGKSVRVRSGEPVPLQVDGEAAGFTPVEMKLLPTRIPFFLPM